MLKITQSFLASENGIDIVKYEKDSLHEELPPIALAHGKNIDAYTKLKGDELKAAKEAIKLAKEQALNAEQGDDQ